MAEAELTFEDYAKCSDEQKANHLGISLFKYKNNYREVLDHAQNGQHGRFSITYIIIYCF
jgi:hypothetical protein